MTLLRAQVPPTPTGNLEPHDVALDIGLAINHSTYDTLYVAFAVAMGPKCRGRRWPIRAGHEPPPGSGAGSHAHAAGGAGPG